MAAPARGQGGCAHLLEIEESFAFPEQEDGATSAPETESSPDRPQPRRTAVRLAVGGAALLAVTLLASAPSRASLRQATSQDVEGHSMLLAAADAQMRSAANALEAPPPLTSADCSWEGSDCTHTRCCKRQGFSCWSKNEFWASCSETCEELVSFSTDGKIWECDKLGGAAVVPKIESAPQGQAMGTSLFCFTVVTPQGTVPPGVHEGYENAIIDKVRAKKLGIFQCDASAVFEGERVATGDWKSIVNTDIFIRTWKKVKADGQYKMHDWTVKVDTDAVFFPFRLKYHLEHSLRPPADAALYMKNIDFKFGFMGSLEVLSKGAVDLYLANVDSCAEHLGENGGEDHFTMACLDSLGVGHMRDNSLLNDKYMSGKAFHLFDVDPCLDQGNVAFHPYKHINSWLGCYNVAMKIQKPDVFVNCGQRFPDDACSLSSELSHSNGGLGIPTGK